MLKKKALRQLIGLFIIIAICSCNTANVISLSVSDLRTEYLTDPLGLDVRTPRFSWTLGGTKRGTAQSAYRVIISHSREQANKNYGEIWDSRKVNSDQTTHIEYHGKELKSGEKYFWRVKIWDNNRESGWSPVHSFQVGLLDENDWQAEWITNPDSTISAPLFRRAFRAAKRIRSAYIYVTGVGYYELYINGQKVGNHVLDPAMTDFRKRVLYETYDVKNRLNESENVMGLMLGNGAWRVLKDDERYAWPSSFHSFGTPRCLVQLQITYMDGSREMITSNDTWKTSSGPITYNNVYSGEDYDARLEQSGWTEAGFDDSSWQNASGVRGPGGVLDSQLMPPVRVTKTIRPVNRTHPDAQTYLFDLGQNIPGWWRIKVTGKRGTELKIRGAETLNDSLFPARLSKGDRLSTSQSFHKNVWTTYTLKGEGEEIYEPHFFYTSFRYVEVKVKESGMIDSLDIEGRMAHSDLLRNGHFASSDSLINRIYRSAIRSQRSNQHGYPTDCPHREKGGYLGDGQVIAEASLHDLHMHAFYEKWLNDMSDAQQANGRIPNTSPTILGGTGGGIAWGSASVLIPWWMYQYYEDSTILRRQYATMGHYMDYLRQLARTDSLPQEPYIINEFGGYWDSLGEWCAPGEDTDSNNPLVNTAYWYLDSKTFAYIAGILGKTADRQRYLALADTIKQAFNQKFFDPETNLYGMDRPYETYLLLALDSGLVPKEHEQAVMDNLIHDIMVTRKGHLGTGILGTKHLFRTLAGAGREDVLQTIISQTSYPGWGYWMEHGATTLWERWDGEGSHNHQMFGSVNEYFYKYLAGIRAPTDGGTSTGYRSILIKPYIPEGLKHVEASLETIRGTVKSAWTHSGDELNLEVTLPPNTKGKVSIPTLGMNNIVVAESGQEIWVGNTFVDKAEGISEGTHKGSYLTFDVASGSYSFRLAAE